MRREHFRWRFAAEAVAWLIVEMASQVCQFTPRDGCQVGDVRILFVAFENGVYHPAKQTSDNKYYGTLRRLVAPMLWNLSVVLIWSRTVRVRLEPFLETADPLTYAEASVRIVEALRQNRGKLAKPAYSTDTDAVCPHCRDTLYFRVEAPKSIFSILGYC
ncbi:hypothetical protein [Rhizobium sp. NPDC090279]|uniref:hypothetical protein n=1 Tax=Rhizobium sp. NPDC090279 TaxID=3364499 RepID=UPI00383A6463